MNQLLYNTQINIYPTIILPFKKWIKTIKFKVFEVKSVNRMSFYIFF